MFGNLAKKLFGSRNDRLIKNYNKKVELINGLEAQMAALSDAELKAKTNEFKERLQEHSLKSILPEAFAVVREASKRVLGLRHHDVQLIGGMVLNDGKIAEMRTGEGKTLVATLAVYLNALTGKGVHVVTVNDYLARRDGTELAQLYGFLGLSTGIIVAGMSAAAKREAYNADITYGTNNEFGFDYLRTNMAMDKEERLQRELNFAIVDEVDSILIDEARTPLIISGEADMDISIYAKMNEIVPLLEPQREKDGPGDFSIDEKSKQIGLTDAGHDKVEAILRERGMLQENESIYQPQHLNLFHCLNACLRAHHLFQKNVDYIIKHDEVVIVDEFTGRTMEGRRWSDGLHQAVEIKEGVPVKQESQTLASITYQNYFRLYSKLAGMTGTADTEAFEFQEIYGLETVVIPTNKPVQRKDHIDQIYLNQKGKYNAIVQEIKEYQAKGTPILVGTASIETSELISKLLEKEGIKHNVLNAKQHEREAEIVAMAGRCGMVTIATNMAGRGTDIVLGGSLKMELEQLPADASEEQKAEVRARWQQEHDKALAAGGLHVIGAERHESRRIDNQLRGRSGRQGDPGSSRFYVALDDNLVRIFAGEKMAQIMARFGMDEKEAIESSMVSRQIEGAQRKVEAHNFDIRKNILEYDDVTNEQRKVIYAQRNNIIDQGNVAELIAAMREEIVNVLVDRYLPADQLRSSWDVAGLEGALRTDFNLEISVQELISANPNINPNQIKEKLLTILLERYAEREALVGEEILRNVERYIVLQTIDSQWRQHLTTMEMLRQAIWLRSRAQKDPRQEYKKESFELFNDLLESIQFEVIRTLAHLRFQTRPSEEVAAPAGETAEPAAATAGDGAIVPPASRNAPCPCGSGKKYKECHGNLRDKEGV